MSIQDRFQRKNDTRLLLIQPDNKNVDLTKQNAVWWWTDKHDIWRSYLIHGYNVTWRPSAGVHQLQRTAMLKRESVPDTVQQTRCSTIWIIYRTLEHSSSV